MPSNPAFLCRDPTALAIDRESCRQIVRQGISATVGRGPGIPRLWAANHPLAIQTSIVPGRGLGSYAVKARVAH